MRAPLHSAASRLATRFAPLQQVTPRDVVLFGGRKNAAARLEALEWIDDAGEIAQRGRAILRTGLISGTELVPYVTVPGVVATGVSGVRELLNRLPGR